MRVQLAGGIGLDQLEGPAVLVITADDLRRPNRDALLSLAQLARPGRIVLIGGTSDRDILMEAINQWRAFRVVAEPAPKAAASPPRGRGVGGRPPPVVAN